MLLAIEAWPGTAGAADPARYMGAQLVAESLTPRPGSTILIGINMDPKPGWHGYWSNPGDSGIPPAVDWSAPQGVRFGPLLHPAPTLMLANGTSSFVHEGPHILLSRMTLPRLLASGTAIPVKAQLSWAACTATQCVPLRATLRLRLIVGSGAPGPAATSVRAAASKLPREAAPSGSFSVRGNSVRLRLPPGVDLAPASTRFFSDDNDVFRTAAAHAAVQSGTVTITGPGRASPKAAITGVASDGRAAYRLVFRPAESSETPAPISKRKVASATPELPAVALGAPAQPVPAQQSLRRHSGHNSDRLWRGIWVALAAMLILVVIAVIFRRR